MKIIKKITIRYFRSIYATTLDNCGALNIISGKNDSGKSNVLRALNLFFNEEADWKSKLEFYHDFSAHRLDEVRKASIKGKQFIRIEIEFFRPSSYSGSLPPTFSISRTWLRESKQFQESTNLDSLEKAGKLPSTMVTAKRALQTFLNKIHYEYVPAIKDRAFSQHLLARLQKTLLDSTIESATGIPILAANLAKNIQSQVDELKNDFFTATGLATVFEPPKQLSELFQAFNVATENSTDQAIPLSSRGDGIQARYLSSVLNYIAEKSNKFFIWGFEEPENSLEFRYTEELARDFENRYSHKSQIFTTTHSPAFVSLNSSEVTCFRVFQENQKTVLVNLNNPKNGGEHQIQLEHELGVLNIQKQIQELYAEKIREFSKVEKSWREAEQELALTKMSLLLVEGKTDKSIIETAWAKLYSDPIPFRIRVADPAADGSTAGTGMLAKTIEGVHPEDGRYCIALFDNDSEGIKAFGNLSKNFSLDKDQQGLRAHVNKLSYAMLLPAPQFRQDYLDANNHMIEFMFPDLALEKKVDGFGLRFKKTEPKLIINGEQVQDAKQYFLPGLGSEFAAYRKIHDGKDHFAQKVVPSLPAEDFESFELLFEALAQFPGFAVKI